tara:strand:+ start:2716 stop:3528 length:813 start_codon:yes stop_codon:yes gene_type:complete
MKEEQHTLREETETGQSTGVTEGEASISDSTTTGVQSEKPSTSKALIILGVVLGAVVFGGAVVYFNGNADTQTAEVRTTTNPDTVLATVNGEPILQQEVDERISEAAPALAAQGIDVNDPTVRTQISAQIVDDIINVTLLSDAAGESGAVPDATLVESEIENYVLQSGGEEGFESQLSQMGLTREVFTQRISEQLLLQTYIAENIDAENITVTDDEISAFYDSVVAGQEGAPSLADLRDQIEMQLVTEKQQQATQEFIDTLRAEADIVIN